MNLNHQRATEIVRRLREAGHTALFAGGCVRDMMRGVEPHDFDIATSAPPEVVQELFPRTVAVGAQFGVILVLMDDHPFEVATFRADADYTDGRRPARVRFTSPEEDAQRRDFTINGMFFDPMAGEVIDYVGGRADIERKLIRTIGEARHRFSEDKLRLLRCVRFAANLGYEIETTTLAVTREMAGQISAVSAERIRDELVKILTRDNPGRGLLLLEETGLLREILPEVAAMKGCQQPPQFHPEGDVFTHVRLMLDAMPKNPSVVLALSVLLHDVGKPPTFTQAPDRIRFHEHDRVGAEMTAAILRRLRFSNNEIEKVAGCVAEHMRFRHVQEMRASKIKRLMARETFADELELHRLDCLSSHGSLDNYEFLKRFAELTPPEIVKPPPLVTGRDLLALGFTPGPFLGAVLRELEELQLDERLPSKEAALALARQRLAESNLPGAKT